MSSAMDHSVSQSHPNSSLVHSSAVHAAEDSEKTVEVDSAAVERERKIKEVFRDVYDQLRKFVEVPHGLIDPVHRHGLNRRKAGRDGYIRAQGSRRYHKDERTHTSDGSLIIHLHDVDPHPAEIDGQTEIDEEKISVALSFPKHGSLLELRLQLPPWPPLVKAMSPRRHENTPPPNRLLLWLEYFSEAGKPSPWSAFTSLKMPHTDPHHDNGLKCLEKWVNDCLTNHPKCIAQNASQMPARLLHISVSKTVENDGDDDDSCIHLQLVDCGPDINCDYVALSHTWRLSRPMRTTLQNLEQHKRKVPVKSLSRCLYEAIVMTLLLGIDYIWIDALCIIQDDSNDWEREAPRMGKIYSGAVLIIAAHGGNLGLVRQESPPIHDPFRKEDAPVYCRESFQNMHKAFFSEPSDPSNWFGRSWCMQERLFARRILHFGGAAEECVFECCTSIVCECGRIVEADEPNKETMKMQRTRRLPQGDLSSADDLWQFYIHIVEDYSARGLTFAVDTFPAISAVMSSIPFAPDEYLAGIWRYGLLLSLQWESMKTKDCTRHETWVAPSWSWASRSGAVMWYLSKDTNPSSTEGKYEFATIVNVSCTRATHDPYGKVSAGQLILDGFVTTLEIRDLKMLDPDGRLEMVRDGASPCYVTLDSVQDYESVKKTPIVTCLDIMRDRGNTPVNYVSGLVLLESEEAGKYRRIGLSTMREEHFQNAERTTVTIV